jgi:hypothetical protein
MKYKKLYSQEFGAPPPPPPPSMSTPPPPPPPSQGDNLQTGSASTNAIIALVLGILSFIGCGLLAGIPAWIMGKGELGKIDRGESAPEGRTMAKIGMWLGIISTVLSVLFLIIWLLVVIIAMISGN